MNLNTEILPASRNDPLTDRSQTQQSSFLKPSSKIAPTNNGAKTPMNNHLKITQNDHSDNKSHISKYSAVVFTVEKSNDKAKDLDNEQESDDYEEDFEDDFEPYETSNEEEEKKSEKVSSKKQTVT